MSVCVHVLMIVLFLPIYINKAIWKIMFDFRKKTFIPGLMNVNGVCFFFLSMKLRSLNISAFLANSDIPFQ